MINTKTDTLARSERLEDTVQFSEKNYREDRSSVKNSYEQSIHKLEKLSWLMDEAIRLPWGSRIGLDGIIGLIPGVGDISTMLVSAYIIKEARKHGAPKTLVIRMIAHVGMETVLGIIPVIGDLFDFYYKANMKNIKLLKKYLRKKSEEDERLFYC